MLLHKALLVLHPLPDTLYLSTLDFVIIKKTIYKLFMSRLPMHVTGKFHGSKVHNYELHHAPLWLIHAHPTMDSGRQHTVYQYIIAVIFFLSKSTLYSLSCSLCKVTWENYTLLYDL